MDVVAFFIPDPESSLLEQPGENTLDDAAVCSQAASMRDISLCYFRDDDNVQSYAHICEVISVRLGKAVAKRPVPKQHGDHDEQVKRGFNTRQGSRDGEGG